MASIYGWSGWQTACSLKREGISKDVSVTQNVLAIAGYCPIVGIVSGMLRICAGTIATNLSTRVYLVVRGILEMLGLGILFLIPDLGVSIHRHLCA